MKSHTVTGGGGVKLHVAETGARAGKPILFIHGFSQCSLAWSRQMNSALADEFRLVALDLRGHGLSEKPADAYGDAQLWADDLHAVIESLELEQPVLSAWSYGGVVISDYVSRYGETDLAGTNWVAGITRLGEPLLSLDVLGREFLALLPGLFSDRATASVAALERLIELCVTEELSAQERYLLLGFNVTVPPQVRTALFSRKVDNDAVVAEMHKPMLLCHGTRDAVVLPAMSRRIRELAAHAKVSIYEGVGHAPFWDEAERFNVELAEFRRSI